MVSLTSAELRQGNDWAGDLSLSEFVFRHNEKCPSSEGRRESILPVVRQFLLRLRRCKKRGQAS